MGKGTLYSEPQRHKYMDESNFDLHHRSLLANILQFYGLHRGDHVLEIGCGSGRYSELLMAAGLRVTALEPDPVLFEKCSARLADYPEFKVIQRGVGEIPQGLPPVSGVCGFHVLHHLDGFHLDRLRMDIAQVAHSSQIFSGWFFVEPNPYNPLYPIQIATSPSMRWSEERGIWSLERYRRLAWSSRMSAGLLPPQVCRKLPERVLARTPNSLSRVRFPWALYEIIGARHVVVETKE